MSKGSAPNTSRSAEPIRADSANTPTIWLWAFWALLWGAGWSVLELLSGEIRVASAYYRPRAWLMWAAIAAAIWSVICLIGSLVARSRWGLSSQDGASIARRRTIALLPVIPVLLCAAIKHFFDLTTFAVVPVSAALLGWAAGRWACSEMAPNQRTVDVDRAVNRSITPSRGWWIVGIACAVCAIYWYLSLESFRHAGKLGYVDIGLFASRLLNTAHWTHPFRDHAHAVPFEDHFNPGLYLLTPLAYAVDILTLLNAAGALACVVPAFVWYVYALRAGWSAGWAVGVAIGWLFLPGLSHAMFAHTLGFHPILLAMPCLAISLLFLQQKRWLGFAVAAALACSFRETVALAYVGIGLWLAISKHARRAGVITAIASAGYLVLVILIIIPAFRRGEAYIARDRFSHLGDSLFEVLLSPINRPGVFWSSVLSHNSLMLCLILACSVGLWSLLRVGRRWIVLLPEGVFLLLWRDPLMRSIAYHYHAVLLVLLYWSCIDGLTVAHNMNGPQCDQRRNKRLGILRIGSPRTALATVVASSFFGSMLLGWWPQWHDTTPFDFYLRRTEDMQWVASQVSANDTVAATQRAGLHCLAAKSVHVVPDDDVIEQVKPDVCILEYADEWGRFELATFLRDMWEFQRSLMDAGYVAVNRRDHAIVYRRADTAAPKVAFPTLAEPFVDEIPPANRLSPHAALTRALTIAGMAIEQLPANGDSNSDSNGDSNSDSNSDSNGDGNGGRGLRIRLYLAVTSVVPTDYGIAVSLRPRDDPDRGDLSVAPVRPAGGMIVSSSKWQPGQIVEDEFHLPWVVPFEPDLQTLLPVVHLYDLRDGRLAVARMVDSGH